MIFKNNVKVRYQETDQMGVVHHSVYPIWYEEARGEFMAAIGISYLEIEEMGIFFPLSKLSCKYIRPALYGDNLTIHTSIKSFSPIKMELEYNLYKNDVLINTGYTEHPFVSKDFKLLNLKKTFPTLYSQLLSCLKN